jgi:transcriptional antiterminator RfaH
MSEQQIIAPTRFDPVMPKHVAWFCLRSQQKHEKIAAGHLAQIEEVEVFSPRIRFPRSTQQGPVWVTESMFPNYLFARFDWEKSLARVHYAPGVKHIVHFGVRWPTVPDEVIEELRANLGAEQLHVIDMDLQTGDPVELSGGAFHGLKAVVTQVMSSGERIAVLMDFLGRQTMIEVSVSSVIREKVRG